MVASERTLAVLSDGRGASIFVGCFMWNCDALLLTRLVRGLVLLTGLFA